MSPLRFPLTMLATASVAFVADPSAAGVSANGSFVVPGAPNVMTPPNGTPIGVDDEFETVQDTRLIVEAPGVLANDSDPDGDPISFGFNSIPSNGTIFGFLDDGAFTYEPDPGFVGLDTFLYSVQDDQGNFTGATVEVTITVTAAPDPTTTIVENRRPDGINDAFEVVENTSLNVAAPGVLANDSDPDGDPIEVTGTIQPANGLVQMSPQGSFAYTPDPGFTGLDSFLYEVSDDQGNSTGIVVEVVITVIAAPDPTTSTTTTTTEPSVPTTEGARADAESGADPAPPTDPASEVDPPPTDPTTPTEPDGTGSAPEVDQTGIVLAGTDEPTGVLGAAGATPDPAVTTTTLLGTLPVTGGESIALGLGVLLVACGAVLTALGTIATHGSRRAGRGYHVRHR